MKSFSLARVAVCLTMFFCSVSLASASQLDWDTQTGAAFNSGNGWSSDMMVDGMIVNVTVGGSTANFVPTVNNGSVQSPAVTRDLEGGTAGPENSLVVGGDFNNTAQYFTVTVTFKTLGGALLPVSGVNFQIFDVDRGGTTGTADTYTWVDRISGIQATLGNTTNLNPNAVTGTAGGNTVLNNIVTGAGNVNNTGATSNGGNVTIDFGAQSLTSFTFNYGSAATAEGANNASVAQADPVRQVVALHDISFVPEPGTEAILAIAGGLVVMGCLYRHDRVLRRK